jgi:hypothetical protein
MKKTLRWQSIVDNGRSYPDLLLVDVSSGKVIFFITRFYDNDYYWYAQDNDINDYLLNHSDINVLSSRSSQQYQSFEEAKGALIKIAHICGYEILNEHLHAYV